MVAWPSFFNSLYQRCRWALQQNRASGLVAWNSPQHQSQRQVIVKR